MKSSEIPPRGRGANSMRRLRGFMFTMAMLTLALWVAPALAGCPPGTVAVGTYTTQEGETVTTHVQCGRERSYTPAGNALIGGTTWITGFNVQAARPAVVARARE